MHATFQNMRPEQRPLGHVLDEGQPALALWGMGHSFLLAASLLLPSPSLFSVPTQPAWLPCLLGQVLGKLKILHIQNWRL